MSRTVNRRKFVSGLAATPCLAALNLQFPLIALAAASTLTDYSVNNRISVINGAGGNVVLYRGNQGLTLIDSGSASQGSALIGKIAELTDNAPITTLFNTHWHDENSGGNEALHAAGARIIAHENTKLWLGADFDVHWRNTTHKPRPEEAFPDITFYTDGQMDLGGETVHYYHGYQGHTDGDIYLFFPDSNVMVAGGLLSNYRYPITDIATGGWIGGLINVNAAMLELADENTIIIPDKGPALGKADLQAQFDMLSNLYEKMKELARLGYNAEDMLKEANVTADYDAVWGDPTEFVMETYRGMWAHTYDMGGFI